MSIEDVSKAEIYVQQKAWAYRVSDDEMLLEICPVNQCDNYHFYMKRGGEKDGLWDCKKCGESGGLYGLREKLGDREHNLESTKDMANAVRKPDPLPNVPASQAALIADEACINYLHDHRGFSIDLIKKRFLGMMAQNGKKYLVIPYIENNRVVYAKYRTFPPAEKAFFCPKGYETRLYNADCVTQGMDELLMVEGELDAISCIGQGITNVVGVPGANSKKMAWISRLDAATPKKIYILYDNDTTGKTNVGQEAAETLAKRIALNSSMPVPFNILLPEFETFDGKPGKDINDWFRAGNTKEDFEELKKTATPFEVRGVVSTSDALSELEAQLEGKEILQPTYTTGWESLNLILGGFEPGDVVDFLADAKIGKSTMVLNLLDHLVGMYAEPGLNYCLEMPNARMIRKWVSHVTQTDDSPPISVEDGIERMKLMRAAIPKARAIANARTADLLFCDRPVRHPDEVYETFYQAVRRYGVRFACIDNLQLLCDLTLGRGRSENRTVHMSQISKNFKALATELKLVMFRIVQPKKIYRGDIASHEDADGSSQISKDSDATVVLHRTKKAQTTQAQFESIGFLEAESAFEPQLYTKVSLSRYAAGGIRTLYMDGARSTVRELTPAERGRIKMPTQSTSLPALEWDGVQLEA